MYNLPDKHYEGISYQLLDNGIIELRVLQSSRKAGASIFELLEDLYKVMPETDTIFMLSDASEASTPLIPAMQAAGNLEKRYPRHVKVYTAVLQRSPLASTLQVMMRPMQSKNPMRLFDSGEREKAIAWLLEQREQLFSR